MTSFQINSDVDDSKMNIDPQNSSEHRLDILFENEDEMNVDNQKLVFGEGNHRNIYTDVPVNIQNILWNCSPHSSEHFPGKLSLCLECQL